MKTLACKCKHCHHTWRTIRPQLPAVCPKCKSYNWQKAPVKAGRRLAAA